PGRHLAPGAIGPRAGDERIAPGAAGAGPLRRQRPAAAGDPRRAIARAPGRPAHAGVPRRTGPLARLAGRARAGGPAHRAAGPVGDLSPLSRNRDMSWILVRKLLRDVRGGLIA